MTVRTRFAPSPTGSLHVGGARTALYCLLYARHHNGTFLLRIEDTDRTRSTDEAARGILRDLRWLGLLWDEGPEVGGPNGPYLQSGRLDKYGAAADALRATGHGFDAWESREELGALRAAAMKESGGFRYRRPAHDDDDLARFAAEGRVPVLRMGTLGDDLNIQDIVLGEVTVPVDDLEDFVVQKADGWPTYHFAVVVDDADMGITHVMRGQEHLMNTAKHLALQKALDLPSPEYAHLPIIFNPGGGKMSKRDKAKVARAAARDAAKLGGHPGGDWTWLSERIGVSLDELVPFMKKKTSGVGLATQIADELGAELPMIEVMDFRKAGYVPEALNNYLALLGWSPGDDRELMTLDEMIEAFTLKRVNKTPARFDPVKLTWMNGEYMRSLPMERLLEHQEAYLEVAPQSPFAGMSRDERSVFLALYQQRATTFAALDSAAGFFFQSPDAWDAKAVKKHILKGDGLERLTRIHSLLAAIDDWSSDRIRAAFESAVRDGEKLGGYAQPVRIAITGGPVSPPLFDTLEMLGQASSVSRITACLDAHPPA
jgi:glutamyl/glutaminyl-tRNA synthetase